MKYIVLAALLALSGCMSVSGFETAVDIWKQIDNQVFSAANKALDKEGKRKDRGCSEHADDIYDIYAFCNCKYPTEAWDSTVVKSCIERRGVAQVEVETCQNLPSRQEFCSCRNPISDDPNHIYFRACMEVSEL